MSKQLDVSPTDGCTGKSSSTLRSVLRYVVAIVFLTLLGLVIVVAPRQFKRELIICNESPNPIVLTKVEAISIRWTRREMATDIVLLPKSTIRLPVHFADRGHRQMTFADGSVFPISMSFGWGESEVFKYRGTGGWSYSADVSPVRRFAVYMAAKFPGLNRFLY